ncbi:Protein MAF-1, partial [Aphelenchoides avenae]
RRRSMRSTRRISCSRRTWRTRRRMPAPPGCSPAPSRRACARCSPPSRGPDRQGSPSGGTSWRHRIRSVRLLSRRSMRSRVRLILRCKVAQLLHRLIMSARRRALRRRWRQMTALSSFSEAAVCNLSTSAMQRSSETTTASYTSLAFTEMSPMFKKCLNDAPNPNDGRCGVGPLDLAPLERKYSVSSEDSLMHDGSTDAESSIASSLSEAPFISDEELAQLTVRQLNQRLQGHDRRVINAIKQKRRTLKNRGYAFNCRIRRIQGQLQLEADNITLREQVRYLSEA